MIEHIFEHVFRDLMSLYIDIKDKTSSRVPVDDISLSKETFRESKCIMSIISGNVAQHKYTINSSISIGSLTMLSMYRICS